MTYYDLMMSANRKLDNDNITLGEYEEMIAPLKREIEPEKSECPWYGNDGKCHFAEGEDDEPERKKGHWIKHYDDLFPEESTIECSECHNHQDITIDDSYCPNCGADMREVQSGSCE